MLRIDGKRIGAAFDVRGVRIVAGTATPAYFRAMG